MPKQSVFQAISDPTRRQILRDLRERDLSAGEIAATFSVSKPSISHHLNILKQADLISDQRSGQHMIYSLNTSVFEELITWCAEFFGAPPPAEPSEKEKRSDYIEPSGKSKRSRKPNHPNRAKK
ncbi:MAG: autorepressor SdpR family transcription factor [Peptococcaceae bacterium]|nr:autorepressor SdpR family transcription factor [Peptococcaceae bacterium]